MGFFSNIFKGNRFAGGDFFAFGGGGQDKLQEKLGLRTPKYSGASVLGQTFSSGASKIDSHGYSIDPSVTANRKLGMQRADENILGIQASRGTFGSEEEFMRSRLSPLVRGIETGAKKLVTRLDKTGVEGEFGTQSKRAFAQSAMKKYASGEAMAYEEYASILSGFDNSEKGALAAREVIKSAAFAQEARAQGMSNDILYQLTAIDLKAEADYYNEKSADNAQKGNIIGIIGSIFSSRTFKHDKTTLDNQQVLKDMLKIKVEKWKYNGEDTEHIGCYAEDFNEKFGEEGEKTISVVDIIGVLMASIQAQQAQIDALKGEAV